MKSSEQLKREIMGRVYMGYVLRLVWSFATLRLAVILGSVVGIVSSVSIRHVLQNMPSPTNVPAAYNFMSSAVLNTELAVQLSLMAIIVIGLFTIVQMVRNRRADGRVYA